MLVELNQSGRPPATANPAADAKRQLSRLVALIRAAGLCWALLFVAVGLACQLQLYADGAIFSYAIAAEDPWAFHWHNISGRLTVFLLAHLPSAAYVALTHDAAGGVFLYGVLFFAAPLAGLAATWAADNTEHRTYVTMAALSTACLCPLVFGFPTEMWMAHSLFWPALALSQCARPGPVGGAVVLAAFLALAFTHEGALILLASIVASTLLLKGTRAIEFTRAAMAALASVIVWALVKVALPPDPYFQGILPMVVASVFDFAVYDDAFSYLLVAAPLGYLVAFALLRPWWPKSAHAIAAALVASGLAIYWLAFDQSLHSWERYPFRTVLIFVTPLLGALAAFLAVERTTAGTTLARFAAHSLMPALRRIPSPALAGAFLAIMLVHGVETAKFASAWVKYENAIRALAMGVASDPWLGNPQFTSESRVEDDLEQLGWHSTTQYLSVLVAPGLRPRRMVVDADAGYYWLSCRLAVANEAEDVPIPKETRQLVRAHACLHRAE